MSAGFRSAAMLARYFAALGSQIPERSGLPSAVRGGGAPGFILPSGTRGTLGVLTFGHWANAGRAAPGSASETKNKARQPSLIWLHSISRSAAEAVGTGPDYEARCRVSMAAL